MEESNELINNLMDLNEKLSAEYEKLKLAKHNLAVFEADLWEQRLIVGKNADERKRSEFSQTLPYIHMIVQSEIQLNNLKLLKENILWEMRFALAEQESLPE